MNTKRHQNKNTGSAIRISNKANHNRQRKMLLSIAGMAAFLLVVLVSKEATSATINPSTVKVAGVPFQSEKTIDDRTMEVQGKGLFKYLSLIKVVAGALYVERGWNSKDVLGDVPKQLELSYFVKFSAKDFAKATREGIKRNVPKHVFEKVERQIDELNRLYRDVSPGDRYTLTYIPGHGTTLALNDKPLGVVPGAEFASALYTIWLGSKDPMDRKFRDALLNG